MKNDFDCSNQFLENQFRKSLLKWKSEDKKILDSWIGEEDNSKRDAYR